MELAPYPFGALVDRLFDEPRTQDAIFDHALRNVYRGSDAFDFSVRFHGHGVSSPLGPAAGPQTQMAQNIVLSWLGGCRVFELKTVQINDRLTIPRPCIDMTTIGFNAEWSQELKLEESLDEYVKGAMLVAMSGHHPDVSPKEGFDKSWFDISVGYDLAGIQHERVDAFLRGMRSTKPHVDRFRKLIPSHHAGMRDIAYPDRLSDTVTLSTFHGCPPDEIERIIRHLMDVHRFHCIVKFNPTLLGPERVRQLLRERMGYEDLSVPESAFQKDTTWEQAVAITERLASHAESLGLGFGVKLSNTLIVSNTRGFLPESESEVYLSGPPLHVLAMELVRRFRDRFGATLPISFAAGIDRQNFPDAVALGLTPITTCSDLLKPRGYGRLPGYYEELEKRMEAVGATDVDTFIRRAYPGGAASETREAAVLRNTQTYADALPDDTRYHQAKNAKRPKKIGRHLRLFDCLTCDKCIPVCPNDANFWFEWPERTIPTATLTGEPGAWRFESGAGIQLEQARQIGTFADFCNECGNCDVFCPEDGGPYRIKPRFFGTEKAWRRSGAEDGFYLARTDDGDRVLGRMGGAELELVVWEGRVRFRGADFDIRYRESDPEGTISGTGQAPVDLTPCFIMDYLRHALLDTDRWNYVNAASRGKETP